MSNKNYSSRQTRNFKEDNTVNEKSEQNNNIGQTENSSDVHSME